MTRLTTAEKWTVGIVVAAMVIMTGFGVWAMVRSGNADDGNSNIQVEHSGNIQVEVEHSGTVRHEVNIDGSIQIDDNTTERDGTDNIYVDCGPWTRDGETLNWSGNYEQDVCQAGELLTSVKANGGTFVFARTGVFQVEACKGSLYVRENNGWELLNSWSDCDFSQTFGSDPGSTLVYKFTSPAHKSAGFRARMPD